MRRSLLFLGVFIILLAAIAFSFYKLSPTVKEIVGITFLNLKEVTKFEVKDENLYMNGLINSQTYNQFVKIINDNPQISTLVEVQMEGSIDDDVMIKLAYFVREKGLNTKLLSHSNINSGAVDLFLAGVERTMEKGAHIGVHSWSDGVNEAKEFPRDAPEHEQNRKYIEEMLGKDNFYWFTIYAAPADGIKEMTEAEIGKYGLLTQPIITKNLSMLENTAPGVIASKFANVIIGNIKESVIINLQGGPITEFALAEAYEILVKHGGVDIKKFGVINMHQEQTLKPWLFKKAITFEEAKEYDKKSVQNVAEVIRYFKKSGKKVYVVGISFGAFVAQDLLATYGNVADGYLIMVGRLDMPEKVWSEFSKGNYVGFKYDKKEQPEIVPFSSERAGAGGGISIEDKNMSIIAAGLGYKRYTKLLKHTDLSNVIYAYGKSDEQVGSLSNQEVKFLQSKGVKVLEGNLDHGSTVDGFVTQGLKLLLNNN